MKLFKTPQAISAELEAMQSSEDDRREDRATVSSFFNGEPPLTDAEAEELGITINVNSLFGYADIAATKDQLFGLFTKPTEFYLVDFDAAPAHARSKWKFCATQKFNLLVKGSQKFKAAYEGGCGDASLHGEAVFFNANPTHWCPTQTALSEFLIPDDAPLSPEEQTHWGVETTLSLRDLHRYAEGDFPGWNKANVRALLRELYKSVDKSGADSSNNAGTNWEELEYQRQANPGETSRRRPAIKVEYFYQVRADLKGNPVDLTIKLSKNETIYPEGSELAKDPSKHVLFESEALLESADQVLHPFFADCMLGGKPLWHRVLGLGHLNYQLNHGVELLINRAMQGTFEGMMNIWKAKDAAAREDIEKILVRHNGVVPEGVDLIQQRYTPDFRGALGMIQYFRQHGARNARQMPMNEGASGDMLEVQALALQGQMGNSQSTRTSNWYDNLDNLGQRMWARLVNPFIRPEDPGYSDAKKLQAALEAEGIPLYYCQPHNVKVSCNRVLGDGDSSKERMGAAWLAQNRAMFPPQSQQRITRIATAAMTGSYKLAEELSPIDEKPDGTQVRIADGENNTCIVQGRPPQVNDADVDDIHFQVHLEGLISLVGQATQQGEGAFTPKDFMSFRALGAHCVMHVQKVQAMVAPGRNDMNKAKAGQWMQALNEVVSVGEKLAHNMQQKQQDSSKKMDPTDQAKLQLAFEQLQLNAQKFQFSREKWERQQNHRESTDSFRQMLELERNHREGADSTHKRAIADVTTALAIADKADGGAAK